MKRIKIILSSICVLTIFLTGCADNVSNNKTQATTENNSSSITSLDDSDMKSDVDSDVKSDVDSDTESDIIKGFRFSSSLNVFYKNDDSLKPVGNEISISEDTDITLTLINNVEPDATLLQKNIPLRLYLFADNQPIEFSLDDKKYSQECNTTIDAHKEQHNNISFHAKKDGGYL